jgi:hypothetical protein
LRRDLLAVQEVERLGRLQDRAYATEGLLASITGIVLVVASVSIDVLYAGDWPLAHLLVGGIVLPGVYLLVRAFRFHVRSSTRLAQAQWEVRHDGRR